MTLLLVLKNLKAEMFAGEFGKLAPDLTVRSWPDDIGDPSEITHALAWKPPAGVLKSLPNLKVIFSMGAGVDHLFSDPDLPDVPVVRFVDPNLTMRMSEYVCLHVLTHQRRMLEYRELQARGEWQEVWPQPGADEVRVGVMGLGVLGRDAAEKLRLLGFDVAGWSRTQKQIAGVTCFAGEDGLGPFLARTDVLVSLLPYTPETKGFMNYKLFARLARDGRLPGPVLINAGRGGSQVEADILAALETGDLWAASLDVFEEEPLPVSSLLWTHPRVIVTPHNASISDNRAVCRYVLEQMRREERGEPMENVVDARRGY
jgi:glyoxylate/hydroxypyruvate reductase